MCLLVGLQLCEVHITLPHEVICHPSIVVIDLKFEWLLQGTGPQSEGFVPLGVQVLHDGFAAVLLVTKTELHVRVTGACEEEENPATSKDGKPSPRSKTY